MQSLPSPLPLWITPWYLRLLGYPYWRYKNKDMSWSYLTDKQYYELFGRNYK